MESINIHIIYMYNEQANKLEETFIIKSTILLRETAGDSERERSPLGALLSVWFVSCFQGSLNFRVVIMNNGKKSHSLVEF